MPGRLRKSFRSGNLAEHLGLLLLKGVAAVADIPRQEDVGLDAIATLLRRDEDGNCYAEDSFSIQLKSDSVTSIQYQDHELEWLIGQTQPLFIGLVSLADVQIALYPTLFVNQAVLSLHAKKVTIRFGVSGRPSWQRGQAWAPWAGDGDDAATVWLGPPILTWTASDLVDSAWQANTHAVLKRFLLIARRELELLSFGQSSVLNWSTNEPQSIKSHFGMMKGHPDDLPALAARCAPCLQAIMLQALTMRSESGDRLMASLLALAAALRDTGVEIDEGNLFGKFFSASQRQPKEGA